MSWIEKIQKKSQPEKIRILWITVIATVLILIGVWILVGNVKPQSQNNSFQNISNSVKNFRLEK